ncbi:MAG: hypothetical protein ILP02_04420 [Clostridia bacterium]|nr:hypothetical protein [Clostridia bacterium]
MARKIFNADFFSVFKPWICFASGCLFGAILTVIGQIGMYRMTYLFSTSLLSLGVLGFYCFPVATIVLLIKNYAVLFIRRGYLTFMLPVKRSTLVLSTVLTAGLFILMTAGVMIVNAAFCAFLESLFIPEYRLFGDLFFGDINVLQTCTTLVILLLCALGFVTGVYMLITSFRINAALGKRNGGKIAAIVVGGTILLQTLALSLLIEGLSAIYPYAAYQTDVRAAYGTIVDLASIIGLVTINAVFIVRALYLVENRLNLR